MPLAAARVCDDYTDNVEYPLRLCDSGEAVRIAQLALRSTVAPELVVDGYFGPRTEAAVHESLAPALATPGLHELFDGDNLDRAGGLISWRHAVGGSPLA